MPREGFMRLAIEKAREGMAQGQWPYGACLVKEGEVFVCVHNVTRATMDPTAHAEIHALREGCVKLQGLDLTGCEIYATCEPCPMCFTACHNAEVSSIVYGASLEDSPNASRRGRVISSSQMKELLDSPIRLISGFLRDEAMQLFNL
jgi:guanine deaminase